MNVLTEDKTKISRDWGVQAYLDQLSHDYQLYLSKLADTGFDIKKHSYSLQYCRSEVYRAHLNLCNDIATGVCEDNKKYLNIGCGGGFLEKIFLDRGKEENIIGVDWNYTDLFFQPIRNGFKVAEMTSFQVNNLVTSKRYKIHNKYSGNTLMHKDFDAIILIRFNAFWDTKVRNFDSSKQFEYIKFFLRSVKKYSNKLIWITQTDSFVHFDKLTRNYLDSIVVEHNDHIMDHKSATLVLDLEKVVI